jgi:uncharacterized protein YgbK (DUF1537 family)
LKKFLIIADDFTGANDTGVQLKKRGLKTNTVFSADALKKDNLSYVIDTESRALKPDEAYEKVNSTAKKIDFSNFDFIYKKVDSTLRGNIPEEIKAICDIYNPEVIIFDPAFPENKRIVLNTNLMVNGIKVEDTEISKDPRNPVHESSILKLMENGLKKNAKHYNLDEIRKNSIDFSNGEIFTFDTENNDDFKNIISAAVKSNKKILWCGSAGLANAIINFIYPTNPVLSIIGSISDVSRKQAEYVLNHGGFEVKLDIASILEGKSIDSYVDEAVNSLKAGRDTMVVSAPARDDYNKAVEYGKKIGISGDEVSKFTQNVLGKVTEKILSKANVSGMFITGGDTAISIINSLNIDSVEILYEVMPGIPLNKVNSGKHNGMKIITKAGAFGKEDALSYSINRLKENIF